MLGTLTNVRNNLFTLLKTREFFRQVIIIGRPSSNKSTAKSAVRHAIGLDPFVTVFVVNTIGVSDSTISSPLAESNVAPNRSVHCLNNSVSYPPYIMSRL